MLCTKEFVFALFLSLGSVVESIPFTIPMGCAPGVIPIDNGTLITDCCTDMRRMYLSYCSPQGIFQCTEHDNITHGVSTLVLQSCNLEGAVPANLTDMRNLTILDLSGNALTGPLPVELNNLKWLNSLDISRNSLSGMFGHSFFNLSANLTFINASMNKFQQYAPDLTTLENLDVLDLSSNELVGSIHGDIGNMKGLKILDFSANHFQGALPATMDKLLNLTVVHLRLNNLAGTLPAFFGNHKVAYLDLRDNDFVGTVPDNYHNGVLETIFLGGNNLDCPVKDYSAWVLNPNRTDFLSAYGSQGHKNCSLPFFPPSNDNQNKGLDGVEIALIVLLVLFVCGLGAYCYRQHNDPSKYVTIQEDGQLL